jgi:type III secretory pathway component EscS
MNRKFELREEYTRESNLILAGLIGISVVIVQALIGIHASDLPATIALLAFAIALPMLGMLVILNALYAKYRYASFPLYLTIAYFLGEGGAALGVVAAFWHLSWVAGALIVVSIFLAVGVYFAYTRQLQKDNPPDQTETSQ